METLRLRGIQQPSAVERLLDNFIARSNLLPKNCYQIRDPDTLPPPLQRVVLRPSERGHTCGWPGRPKILALHLLDVAALVPRAGHAGAAGVISTMKRAPWGNLGKLDGRSGNRAVAPLHRLSLERHPRIRITADYWIAFCPMFDTALSPPSHT